MLGLFNVTTFPLNNNTSVPSIHIVADLSNIKCLIGERAYVTHLNSAKVAKRLGSLQRSPIIPLGGVRRVPCLSLSPTNSLDHEF